MSSQGNSSQEQSTRGGIAKTNEQIGQHREWAEKAFAEFRDSIVRFVSGILGDPHLAQDVSQLVFSKFIEQGSKIARSATRSWLFRVAYNEAIQIKRRQKVDRKAMTRMAAGLSEVCESKPDYIVFSEDIQAIQDSVAELPEEVRQIFELRMFRDLKFTEIAEQLEIPLGTALTRMRNALRQIRDRLTPPDD